MLGGSAPRWCPILLMAANKLCCVRLPCSSSAGLLTALSPPRLPASQVVIDAGAVPIFVQLLHSPIDDVREQAVWALGNIAGDSPRCRDLVLQHGALAPLMEQLKIGRAHV